jgi:hypothetical protein
MADDAISVDALNGPAFTAALDEIRHDLDDLREPLEATGRRLVSAASAAAPHLTGRLAAAHRALPAGPKTVRVIADTPYAAVIHWGWPGHGISRRPWLVATWLRDTAPMDALAAGLQSGIDKAAAKT